MDKKVIKNMSDTVNSGSQNPLLARSFCYLLQQQVGCGTSVDTTETLRFLLEDDLDGYLVTHIPKSQGQHYFASERVGSYGAGPPGYGKKNVNQF